MQFFIHALMNPSIPQQLAHTVLHHSFDFVYIYIGACHCHYMKNHSHLAHAQRLNFWGLHTLGDKVFIY